MDRKERVKAVHEFIKSHSSNESSFDALYAKLISEFNTESSFNDDMQANHYLNNLRQTRDKQADLYIKTKARRPKKGAPQEFRDFVSNFIQDTIWALR